MKKTLAWTLLATVIIGLSVVAFGVGYAIHCDWSARSAIKKGDVYGWMKHEFRLSNAQVAKVKAMDEAYVSVCDKHCQNISQAEDELAKANNPKEKAILSEKVKELKGVCQKGLEEHLKAVSTVMPEGQGERYYSMMISNLECMSRMGAQHLINSSN